MLRRERCSEKKAETQETNHIVCYQGSATMLGFSSDMFKYRELICFEFSPNNVLLLLYFIESTRT